MTVANPPPWHIVLPLRLHWSYPRDLQRAKMLDAPVSTRTERHLDGVGLAKGQDLLHLQGTLWASVGLCSTAPLSILSRPRPKTAKHLLRSQHGELRRPASSVRASNLRYRWRRPRPPCWSSRPARLLCNSKLHSPSRSISSPSAGPIGPKADNYDWPAMFKGIRLRDGRRIRVVGALK